MNWLLTQNCDKQTQFCKQLNQCFVTNNLIFQNIPKNKKKLHKCKMAPFMTARD